MPKLADDDEVVLEALETPEADLLADGLTKPSAPAALLLLDDTSLRGSSPDSALLGLDPLDDARLGELPDHGLLEADLLDRLLDPDFLEDDPLGELPGRNPLPDDPPGDLPGEAANPGITFL